MSSSSTAVVDELEAGAVGSVFVVELLVEVEPDEVDSVCRSESSAHPVMHTPSARPATTARRSVAIRRRVGV